MTRDTIASVGNSNWAVCCMLTILVSPTAIAAAEDQPAPRSRRPTFPVTIRVDASRTRRRDAAGLAVLRLRRAELHLHERRQEAARRNWRPSSPQPVYHPHPQPADLRRRHARPEVGLDRRLLRGRRGRPALRLDDPRPHLRHLPGAGREALRPDRLHARGPLDPARALPAPLDAGRPELDLHRLGLSAQGLRRSGPSWSTSGSGTASSDTARPRSRRGTGRSGTSPTSSTGGARPRSITSSTTTPPTP